MSDWKAVARKSGQSSTVARSNLSAFYAYLVPVSLQRRAQPEAAGRYARQASADDGGFGPTARQSVGRLLILTPLFVGIIYLGGACDDTPPTPVRPTPMVSSDWRSIWGRRGVVILGAP